MKILVTGGCGFVGSILVSQLLKEKHHVTVVDTQWFGNFLIKHKVFSYLAEEKKKIELLSFTRAIFIKEYDRKFFMPIMDFVNYHF